MKYKAYFVNIIELADFKNMTLFKLMRVVEKRRQQIMLVTTNKLKAATRTPHCCSSRGQRGDNMVLPGSHFDLGLLRLKDF